MPNTHPLSAWAERRPERTERQRAEIAEKHAAHLPTTAGVVRVSDADLDAMKAAFIRRFDEDLPRTETLMSVAKIGYRMALRDSGSGSQSEDAGTAAEAVGPQSGGDSRIAQNPTGTQP